MPILNFDELASPLSSILKQRKKDPEAELEWTGPTEFHCRIGATCLPPQDNFSKEGLAYHKEQGRSFEDVFIMVALQLGMSQGINIVENDSAFKLSRQILKQEDADLESLLQKSKGSTFF